MQHHRSEASATADEGVHVFDQTNGVVDPGRADTRSDQRRAGASRRSTIAGIAMLSTQKP